MIILLLRIVMVLFVIWLFAALIKDYKESGTKLSEVSMGEKAAYAVMGFVLNLLDTLGVGSNATQAADIHCCCCIDLYGNYFYHFK